MTNLEVAQAAELFQIQEIALWAGLAEEDFETLGKHKAKLTYKGMARLTSTKKTGRLVLVTAMTPTLTGEGKTTVTIGLTQGLQKLGKRAVVAIREPALGPIFGSKGGAAGGGYSQILPMEDVNLFFTGDFPAISAAHNLLSAILDSHLHHGNALRIDGRVQRWPRAVDMNDRALRSIVTGLGGKTNGPSRESGFVITPASEVMAILCLSRSLSELKRRLGEIVAAVDLDGNPITAKGLGAAGAMAALLKDAIRPNLVQTIEHGLAFVHGGPFANIAHGCSSVIATECGLAIADYTVTEAGFGSDLGAEKFMDIVCSRLDRGPDAIVLVATVKAIRNHGAGDLGLGIQNLFRHHRHLQNYGPPIVVAINRFAADSDEDHARIKDMCRIAGVRCVSCDPFSGGGAGCQELAAAVEEVSSSSSAFRALYEASDSVQEKLDRIVSKAYGGTGLVLSKAAKKDLAWIEKHGYGGLPVCVAKTQYSLSDDASLLNAPEGFEVSVRELRLSAGAGFIIAVCGDMMLMPGLGKNPAAFSIDVDDDGKLIGLF